MINAKPRFAVHDNGQIYDYDTALLHDPVGTLSTTEGVYDLEELKAAILAGKPISTALDPQVQRHSVDSNAEFEKQIAPIIAADQEEHEAAVERKRKRKAWEKAQRDAAAAGTGTDEPPADPAASTGSPPAA